MATALVVGATRGIGLAYVNALAARGDRVIGTARRPEDATALEDVAARVVRCDVTDDASVAALAEALSDESLDLLVHNAGVLVPGRLDESPASVLGQIDTNAVGAYRVVRALRSRLAPGAKVALMTSRMGSIEDNTSGGYYGYRASKAAMNAVGRSLARDLAPVPVVLLHPGMVRTEMTGGHGDVDAEQAVAALLPQIDAAGAEQSGRFWHRDGFELPW